MGSALIRLRPDSLRVAIGKPIPQPAAMDWTSNPRLIQQLRPRYAHCFSKRPRHSSDARLIQMVFRAEVKRQQAGRTVEVEGVLDAAAVDQLQAQLHLGSCDCLLLLPGTEVTADGIERLRRLPSRVISSSPYLERWLAERGPRVDPPEGDREALLVKGAEGSAPPAKLGKL